MSAIGKLFMVLLGAAFLISMCLILVMSSDVRSRIIKVVVFAIGSITYLSSHLIAVNYH